MSTPAAGYSPGSPAGGPRTSVAESARPTGYWTLDQCKQAFLDYTGQKSEELKETKEARRYRHGAQYTAEQIRILNLRKQPVVTYNRVGRKIDGIVGFVERLKQDPKAYPRTPKEQDSADLATQAIRYVCDDQEWKSLTPLSAEAGATDGIGGIELELVPSGAENDYDIRLHIVRDGFFYDAASVDLQFEDSAYNGVTRWMSLERAKQVYRQYADKLDVFDADMGSELALDTDRDNKWFSFSGRRKFIRLVDLYYRHNGGWCWSLFNGAAILAEGQSPFYIEDEQISKYLMFSAAVDHDGDRYGFVRNLKSAQDEINQRRSKGLHVLNSNRMKAEVGAFDDVEKARQERSRPDGVVLYNKNFVAEFDDAAKLAELNGQFQFLEDAKNEIDNYGPSQVVTGEGVDGQSGRAIALRQQAAVAELGPFVLSYRAWKIRVYRAIFSQIQRYWTAERWIRVTDDDRVQQFIPINQKQRDPMTGQEITVNGIGQLDVDIILDEGPDTINAMADTHETLKEVLPAVGALLSPQKANAAVEILIESSSLPSEAKRKFREADQAQQQPDPALEMAKKIELEKGAAEVRDKNAAAGLKQAQTEKTLIEARLAPAEAQHEARLDEAGFHRDTAMQERDRQERREQAGADRFERASGAAADRAERQGEADAGRAERVAFKRADLDEAQAARDFQGQQSEADRIAAADAARMKQISA